MRIHAKAPCRVDLAGGTVDIWPLYLFHPGAVTVNFAINLHTSCTIETRRDRRIVFRSIDLKTEEEFDSLDDLRSGERYRLPLHAYSVRCFAPAGGLAITSNSEAPAGAGIGGSSSLAVSLAGALNRLSGSGYSFEKLLAIAQNTEAQAIRVPTGCQDYCAALYGGASAIEMDSKGIHRTAIGVDRAELNRRVVLVYTGEPRQSGINNWEVMKARVNGDAGVRRNFHRIVEIAKGMRAALEKGDWEEAGRLLREEWTNRRKNHRGISTPLIDRLIRLAGPLGARGAKVCGAGGGGCLVFLVEPDARERISRRMEAEGVAPLDVEMARRGITVRVGQAQTE